LPGGETVSIHIAGELPDAVMTGDLMQHPLQCAEPDWNSCFCVSPKQSAATRRKFLEKHSGTSTLSMPANFPSPNAGRLVEAGVSWWFSFDGERSIRLVT
jgi:hypothetical protein